MARKNKRRLNRTKKIGEGEFSEYKREGIGESEQERVNRHKRVREEELTRENRRGKIREGE